MSVPFGFVAKLISAVLLSVLAPFASPVLASHSTPASTVATQAIIPAQTKSASTTLPKKTLAHVATSTARKDPCTKEWFITGYFTPVESDYSGALQTVVVDGTPYPFNSSFLTEIQTEGWGKTHLGNYIGYYGGAWHFASMPLDANDKPLQTDAIAVDPSLIHFGARVTIPTLPLGWGSKTFHASDIGPAIVGKHIDVYTGEGKEAGDMTFQITGHGNTVCVLPK